MAFLRINPHYRHFIDTCGLSLPEHFLNLPALVISGHADRNVSRVNLESGKACLPCFLKCEHRVSWKDRWLNAAAGFGFCSKSSREAAVLAELDEAGIGCPEWIAYGKDCEGRSFLLVRAVRDCRDLRLLLRDRIARLECKRRSWCLQLGAAIARIHEAGFDHPDLYAKHVLMDPGSGEICLLDWQRSRCRREVPWAQRLRDLAALSATLGDDLVRPRERLRFLRAYLRSCKVPVRLAEAARAVERLENLLLRERRIREMREVAVEAGTQNVIWQDGEALCLTREFKDLLTDKIPSWLPLDSMPGSPLQLERTTRVYVPDQGPAMLVQRRSFRPLSGILAWLRRRRPNSPELCQAGLLFRLQRYGIPAPRIMAFGQRAPMPWKVESFLLTQVDPRGQPLSQWLIETADETPEKLCERRTVIQEAGKLLRRMHDGHCYLPSENLHDEPFLVRTLPEREPRVLLGNLAGSRSTRHADMTQKVADLRALERYYELASLSRSDRLRFFLAYSGRGRMNLPLKERIRGILQPRGSLKAVVQLLSSFLS